MLPGTDAVGAKAAEALDRVARAVLEGKLGNDLWHRTNFLAHRNRYLHDLTIVMGLVAADTRILEIGSAPGHFTAALRLAGFEVMGVDLAPERIRDLCDRFGLSIAACDVEREPLPYPDHSFACVVCAETYEHLRWDPFFVLSEIHRVLKHGGLLLLTTPNLYSVQNIARFLTGRSIADPLLEFGKLRSLGHMGHIREYSGAQMRRILASHGFVVQRHSFHDYSDGSTRRGRAKMLIFSLTPRRFRTFQSIVASRSADGPHLSPLPGSARVQ